MSTLDETINYLWQSQSELIQENFSCFRCKNSTGQKSGMFLIDNQIIIDIHFYDDSSITVYKDITDKEAELIYNQDNFYLNIILNRMLFELENKLIEKEKKYKTYQFYENLKQNIKTVKTVKDKVVKL